MDGNPKRSLLQELELLVFDLDGVVMNESRYWNAARLTVFDLITNAEFLGIGSYFGDRIPSPETAIVEGERIISKQFIYEVKRRAVNSNWDLTFLAFGLYAIAILSEAEIERSQFSRVRGSCGEQLQCLGKLLVNHPGNPNSVEAIAQHFWQKTEAMKGAAVIEYLPVFAEQILGTSLPLLEARDSLWRFCYQQFQAWYEGKKGFVLPNDETAIELEIVKTTLQSLAEVGRYRLAIATGRPRSEAVVPLDALGVLQYFDSTRISTYDEVMAAESDLLRLGKDQKLGKPHPFPLLKSIYPDSSAEELAVLAFQEKAHPHVAYIGDTASDILAAQQAGCIPIAVLTGFAIAQTQIQKRAMFAELGCEIILDSIADLPQWLEITE